MFNDHCTCQPVLSGTELKDIAGATYYCPAAVVDSNKHIRIRIRERMPEFINNITYTISIL